MRRQVLVLLSCLLLLSGAVAQAQSLTREQINAISRAVVQIVAYANGEPISSGSGVIIDKTGLILTNRHVIEGAGAFVIRMTTDMRELPVDSYVATAIYASDELDLAALQIVADANGNELDSTTLALPYLDPAPIDVEIGDRIFIFGFPGIGDGYMVLTEGTLTSVANGDVYGQRLPVRFQTSAEIAPGNSGGLAVNLNGEYIGIPTAVRSEERTGGRLGGILPMIAVDAVLAANPPQPGQVPQVPTALPGGGITVNCTNGVTFNNGVEFIVRQMRAGFTYTATVIGLNGFDPVLAVLDANGRGLCEDDVAAAMTYGVLLPTTGEAVANSTSTQIDFRQTSGQNMADVSLVVGGYDNAAGEFVLILEGMAATREDGKGDPFSVVLTPGLVNSGVPLSIYLLARNTGYDSLLYLADTNLDPFVTSTGETVLCDDAGDANSCWGESYSLSSYGVVMSSTRAVPGGQYDSMLIVPLEGITPDMNNLTWFTFVMTSYQRSSFGEYILAFHAGTR